MSFAALLVGVAGCKTGKSGSPITSIGALAKLPLKGTRRVPIRLKAWINLHQTAADRLFIQDETGVAKVEMPNLGDGDPLSRGDNVEITGVATSGGDAPAIISATVRSLGKRRAITSLLVPLGSVAAGKFAFRYVEVEGELWSVRQDPAGNTFAVLSSGHESIDATFTRQAGSNVSFPPGARIRVRGVTNVMQDVTGTINRAQLLVTERSEITTVKAARPDWELPFQTIASIRTLTMKGTPVGRIRLHGTLRYDSLGSVLLFSDATGTIKVLPGQGGELQEGADADIAGYAAYSSGGGTGG